MSFLETSFGKIPQRQNAPPCRKGGDLARPVPQKVLRALEERVCECSQAKPIYQSINQSHHYTSTESPFGTQP